MIAIVMLLVGCALAYRHFTGGGWWTVAVFGLDSRDGKLGKGVLSDVEMVCSVNKKSGEIKILSVFRDTYLRIGDEDYDKINEAYFLGGPEQALKALKTNLDLDVDDYAAFNWKAVIDAINILGGVDVEITEPEFAYINSFITETVEATGVASFHLEHSGMNHLDGVQAVAYARLRLMDTDFNRTERQRRILGLAMEKAKKADGAALAGLVNAVFPQVSTSIGLADLLSLAKNPKKYYISETSGFPFAHEEMKIGKKSCVIPVTLESNVIQLHKFLYGEEHYLPSATVRDISKVISERSGLGEPGKDIESGKNVGASSNTGVEPSVQDPPTSTTGQGSLPTAEEPSPAGAGENGNEPEAEGEGETRETEASLPGEDPGAGDMSIEPMTGEDTQPSPGPGGNSPQPQASGYQGAVEHPGGQPAAAPQASQAGPAAPAAPSPGPSAAIVDEPGQNPTQAGPAGP